MRHAGLTGRANRVQFRLLAADGREIETGEGDVAMVGGALLISPRLGAALRIDPADILSISEPRPYTVVLEIAGGAAGPMTVEMSAVGVMRTQILAELGERRREDTASALYLAGVGAPTVFDAEIDGNAAQLALYDDVLIWVPAAGLPGQLRLADLDRLDADASGYRLQLSGLDGEVHQLFRLGPRTSEFRDLLHNRVNAARSRTAALVAATLPGLLPLTARAVAGLLPDGVPAALDVLEQAAAGIASTLMAVSTHPGRHAMVAELQGRGRMYLAWHQRTSVEVAAAGGAAPPMPSGPGPQDHGNTGAAPGGWAGVMQASFLAAGPLPFGFGANFGANPGAGSVPGSVTGLGLGWGPGAGTYGPTPGFAGGFPGGFFGSGYPAVYPGIVPGGPAGPTGPLPHQASPRSAPTAPNGVTSGHTDYSALHTSGDTPTVLALSYTVIGRTVVYEVLNDPDHATYVFDLSAWSDGSADPTAAVRALAGAMAKIGFRVSALAAPEGRLDTAVAKAVERLPYLARLRQSLAGRVIHSSGWSASLDGVLAGHR